MNTTPGPWKIYKDGVHPKLDDGIERNGHHAICQCFGPDAWFNQHLIAAAPELVKALEFYADPKVYEPHPHGPAFDHRDISFVARAALAKTKGEAA
ncbi:hypothetical protein [Acidomonas methanolica]|uniref:Uncharacterized protein n=1 Tax=Acidomonas methanolica NBRC 104435 TaxID=1231351 RepID=A0A023D6W9_ACIMT|nr:hypothetical protein [Acidomonas methanolica]TCS23827.1 hypothetical protein EDC31_12745 [Acidomonas methanolica]GAJ29829.1 hypothetical protein Amme_083_004 [Acidomonas methanolica NBRC 104435]GBQ52923.1 hypothetical protein AA0498_1834 [Acidomonas methanolica]GEL00178.1 hypothetical protein AME01nite_26760 [Acidomonas methanolica NBRC 104435]